MIVKHTFTKAKRAKVPKQATSFTSITFPISKEAAEKWVIVELMIVKEFREKIFCVMSIKMMERTSFGTLEAICVIDFALLRIGKIFIGLRYFSKFLNSLISIIGIFIRVPFHCEFLVSFFDFRLSSFLVNSQDFVIISLFRHTIQVIIKKCELLMQIILKCPTKINKKESFKSIFWDCSG